MTCADADDRVRSSLPVGPRDFEEVQAALVADATANSVGRLRHRLPVERRRVIVFNEDVERSETMKLNRPSHSHEKFNGLFLEPRTFMV